MYGMCRHIPRYGFYPPRRRLWQQGVRICIRDSSLGLRLIEPQPSLLCIVHTESVEVEIGAYHRQGSGAVSPKMRRTRLYPSVWSRIIFRDSTIVLMHSSSETTFRCDPGWKLSIVSPSWSPEGYAATWDEFDRIVGFRHLRGMHINDSKRGVGSRVDRHAPDE